MIEIKFQFANLDELDEFLAHRKSPAPTEAPGKPEKTSEKTSNKAKPEASAPPAPAAVPAASPPSAAAAPTAAPASPAGEPLTYEKSGLAVKISQAAAKDKPATVALLAKFGVAKGPMLKPEQFDAFGAAIDALLAGEEALG
jgi:hypothetical protein